MTTRKLDVPLPGDGHVVLTLPQPLTPESVLQLEQALAGVLGRLHHEARGAVAERGRLEYASWMQQLCPQRH